jgi:hypothetical protein
MWCVSYQHVMASSPVTIQICADAANNQHRYLPILRTKYPGVCTGKGTGAFENSHKTYIPSVTPNTPSIK